MRVLLHLNSKSNVLRRRAPVMPSAVRIWKARGRQVTAVMGVVLVILVVLGMPQGGDCARREAFDRGAIEAYIEATRRTLPIPGMAVAVVRGGEVVLLEGYGTAGPGRGPVTSDTPFMLASVSKQITALALQQLVVAGKVELDAPLVTYVPEFRLADSSTSDLITVRHLLEHRSGISTRDGLAPYLFDSALDVDDILDETQTVVLTARPGTSWAYSNLNYRLLGIVIERVSGMAYDDYVQARVLAPLGMAHASLVDPAAIPGAARGYRIRLGVPVPAREVYVPGAQPSGYINASAQDMAHVLLAYFNRGEYGDSVVLAPGSDAEGWFDLDWSWQDGKAYSIMRKQAGALNTFSSGLVIFPGYQLGVVVLMNVRPDLDAPAPNASDIAEGIARVALGDVPAPLSGRAFWQSYLLIDVQVVAFLGIVVWRALSLRRWRVRLGAASRRQRTGMQVGLGVDLTLGVFFTVVYALLSGPGWFVNLRHAPELYGTLLVGGGVLAVVGLVKLVRAFTPRPADAPAPACR